MYGICERTGRNITYDESIFSLSLSFKVTSVLNVFKAENIIYFSEKEKRRQEKRVSRYFLDNSGQFGTKR